MGEEATAATFNLVRFARTADYTTLPVVRVGDTIYVPDKSQSHWAKAMGVLKDAAQIASFVALIAAL